VSREAKARSERAAAWTFRLVSVQNNKKTTTVITVQYPDVNLQYTLNTPSKLGYDSYVAAGTRRGRGLALGLEMASVLRRAALDRRRLAPRDPDLDAAFAEPPFASHLPRSSSHAPPPPPTHYRRRRRSQTHTDTRRQP